MINVSEATKSAYRGDSVHKVLTISIPNRNITITNDDIKSESMELTEMIESEENLTFKGCNASQIKFAVKDVATDIRGEYIEASIQAGETDVIPLFKGYVDSQSNTTYEDVSTEFVCYDILHSVGERNMQSWIDGLTFPVTVKNFRDSLFTTLGITQDTVTLVNDSLSISANVKNFLENPIALTLMRWICELNGRFGQIGRDGKFKYRKLTQIVKGTYPSSQTFPSDHTYPSGENTAAVIDTSLYSHIEYQPYEVDGVNRVNIYDSEGVIEGHYGSGSSVFAIMENPIAFSVNMMTAAQNLYSEIAGKTFIPLINLECVGEPWIECGDSVMMNTRKNIVRTYILQRRLHGIQALFDSIESDNDKVRTPATAGEMSMINANRRSVLNIQADLVTMNELIATKATISELNATNVRVRNLEADHVTTQQLQAVQGDIQTLSTNKLDASTASITYATISDLNATNLTVSGKLDASTASVTYATISDLNATNLTVSGKLNASDAALTYATISDLNATNLTVSGKLSAADAELTYATIANLNATNLTVSGKLDTSTFNAIAITTQNLASQTIQASQISGLTITASQITSGTIAADRLSADTIRTKFIDACAVSPLQGRIDIGTIRAGSVQIYDNGYHTLNLNTRTIGGTSVKLVEWS